MNGNWGEVVTR